MGVVVDSTGGVSAAQGVVVGVGVKVEVGVKVGGGEVGAKVGVGEKVGVKVGVGKGVDSDDTGVFQIEAKNGLIFGKASTLVNPTTRITTSSPSSQVLPDQPNGRRGGISSSAVSAA
jgi:hypothetical protein